MFDCPNCRAQLVHTENEGQVFWRCTGCGGRAVKTSTLRQQIVKTVIDQIWQMARASAVEKNRPCPACEKPMAVVVEEPGFIEPLRLDVCPSCQLVWFDPKEFQLLPRAKHEQVLSPEAKQALAQAEVALLQQKARWERQREEARKQDTWLPEGLVLVALAAALDLD